MRIIGWIGLVGCSKPGEPEAAVPRAVAAESAPAVADVAPVASTDPLMVAGQVGLELIEIKANDVAESISTREQTLNVAPEVAQNAFEVRVHAVPSGDDCPSDPEAGRVVSVDPGGRFAVELTNRHADRALAPHIVTYAASGMRFDEGFGLIGPGTSRTVCLRAPGEPNDQLLRVLGTFDDVVMSELTQFDAAVDRADDGLGGEAEQKARALLTLMKNDIRQRLMLARLLHAQGRDLPLDSALVRVGGPADATADSGFGLPENSAMLLYAEIDGGMAVGWYEAGRGPLVVELPVSPSELAAIAGGAVLAVAGSQAADRMPTRREVRPVAPLPAIATTPALVADAVLPPPIRTRLAEVREIVVVPAGPLGRIPWYALEIDGTPLVETHAVTVAPDLAALARAPSDWSAEFRTPLVIGDPRLTEADYPDWDMPPLPGAEAEAHVVADAFGTRALVGAQATKSAVLRRAPRSDLIYLATHGVADPESPLWNSFIALDGGGWTAADVLAQDLSKVRLAVLSACQTGLGQDVDAGTIGLARSFYKAGVPYIVMSLWNVDDAGTQALMTAFVRHLRDVPPSEALRRAADDLRGRGFGPEVWASFAVMGRP